MNLRSDNKIDANIGTYLSSVTVSTIPIATWTQITVFIAYGVPSLTSFVDISMGMTDLGTLRATIPALTIDPANDKVTIGPFLNTPVSISDLTIFSPGARPPQTSCIFSFFNIKKNFLLATCSTPASYCSMSIGPPNTQNCLECQPNTIPKGTICYPGIHIYLFEEVF